MAFSWKKAIERDIRHAKFRKEIMKKNGRMDEVTKIEARIKRALSS